MLKQPTDRPRHWGNTILLLSVHIAAVVTFVWSSMSPPKWQSVTLALVWYCCSGLSITGGYHRLFSHRSYRCARGVSTLYLLFGAAAAQSSALTWASDHRRHHAHTDGDHDPYDSRHGLWWSHIGWVMHEDASRDYSNVRDLVAHPLVLWQHRFYVPIAIAMAVVVPAALATAWHDPFGGLLWAGCVRVVAQYHATFAINSVAHRFGSQPYTAALSARDNLLVALFTMGEGYHNFHHRFPSDYRNGARWFDYDPTKWLVSALAAVGLASELRRAAPGDILRARVQRGKVG